jgi:hypothetical protein
MVVRREIQSMTGNYSLTKNNTLVLLQLFDDTHGHPKKILPMTGIIQVRLK